MHIQLKKTLYLFAAITALQFLLGTSDVMAAEGGEWRHTYDKVMLVVNFTILAFLIIKFLRKPFANFLKDEKEKIARQVNHVEEDLELAQKKMKEKQKIADESDAVFNRLRERIINQGKKRKNEIIEEAQLESQLILKEAKMRIENQIFNAKNMIKAELVDTAVELALKNLPGEITAEDDQKLILDYLTNISARS